MPEKGRLSSVDRLRRQAYSYGESLEVIVPGLAGTGPAHLRTFFIPTSLLAEMSVASLRDTRS